MKNEIAKLKLTEFALHRMASARRTAGLVPVLLAAVLFLFVGTALRQASSIEMGDFKVVYYSARCLFQNGDPYSQAAVLRVYQAEGRESASEPALDRQVKTRFFYPPTVFLFTLPFACMGYTASQVLWTLLSGGLLILASLLAWNLGADYAPLASGVLAGLVLMNSFWLYMVGNSAAIVVGLCVIAVWSFYRERFVILGIICLALSLAVKPNDSGLIWLFLILAGGRFRRCALQTLAVFIVLSVPVVLWVTHVSPHWLAEMRANMESFFVPGGIVDPTAGGMAGRTMDSLVQLQSATSIFFSQPAAYNLASWAICAPLIVFACFAAIKRGRSANGIWLALAVAAPLSMLPTYHLQHDAKILLVAIPACAQLWSQGNALGRLSMFFTSAAIIVTGDVFSFVRIVLTRSFLVPTPGFLGRVMTVALTRPAPLILLATAIFFAFTLAGAAASEVNLKTPEDHPSGNTFHPR